MSRYSALLGCRVEVNYMSGDVLLPATGTLAADSGKFIFLEEISHREQVKPFRWEIPYQAIVDLTESPVVLTLAEIRPSLPDHSPLTLLPVLL